MSLVIYGLGAAVVIAAGGAYIFREKLGIGGGRRKEVMLLRPNDAHFTDVKVVNETDQSLESPRIKGITRFFIKMGKGWTNDQNGGARYLGLEGKDFTLELRGKVSHVINLLEAIKIVLGEIDFGKFTPEAKNALESAKFGVTTEAITTDASGVNQGNENVFTESDKAMIKYHAEENAKAARGGKMEWMPIAVGFLAGCLITGLTFVMKWIKL